MLGHKIFQRLQNDFEVWTTFRQPADQIKKHPLFKGSQTIIGNLDVTHFPDVEKVVGELCPDAAFELGVLGPLFQMGAVQSP